MATRRDLDHGHKEGPGPRPQGGTWTTATMRDLDHGCKGGPGPRLRGETWTTAERSDLDYSYDESDLDHSWEERPGPRLFHLLAKTYPLMLVWIYKRRD
ncbi:hypothetical protein RRG08_044979 [Elysia crispata]|uniref:Uncharacterized protein n=1 Tax=Elysia crispata TaxID=231223 RepID=A0AAE1DNJ3_9GAST|nr:hypothetical protein RRG08_044979 [Elysia crispata]